VGEAIRLNLEPQEIALDDGDRRVPQRDVRAALDEEPQLGRALRPDVATEIVADVAAPAGAPGRRPDDGDASKRRDAEGERAGAAAHAPRPRRPRRPPRARARPELPRPGRHLERRRRRVGHPAPARLAARDVRGDVRRRDPERVAVERERRRVSRA
jgi:hypothetical protein